MTQCPILWLFLQHSGSRRGLEPIPAFSGWRLGCSLDQSPVYRAATSNDKQLFTLVQICSQFRATRLHKVFVFTFRGWAIRKFVFSPEMEPEYEMFCWISKANTMEELFLRRWSVSNASWPARIIQICPTDTVSWNPLSPATVWVWNFAVCMVVNLHQSLNGPAAPFCFCWFWKQY